MPATVKIKAGKYGSAIGLLLERGGAFQTRHERTLIVNSDQKNALEKADLVEDNGSQASYGFSGSNTEIPSVRAAPRRCWSEETSKSAIPRVCKSKATAN